MPPTRDHASDLGPGLSLSPCYGTWMQGQVLTHLHRPEVGGCCWVRPSLSTLAGSEVGSQKHCQARLCHQVHTIHRVCYLLSNRVAGSVGPPGGGGGVDSATEPLINDVTNGSNLPGLDLYYKLGGTG